MVFLFLLDVITSSALYVTFKCGTWIAYGTANGIHYVYNKITTVNQANRDNSCRIDSVETDEDSLSYICNNTNTNETHEKNNEFIILTRQEYEELQSRRSNTPK